MQVGAGLRMHRDAVTAGLRKGFEIGIDGGDHQMAIEEGIAVRPKRLDDIRPEGNVRHEMPVHDIEMNPVRAGLGDIGDFLSELGEIGS